MSGERLLAQHHNLLIMDISENTRHFRNVRGVNDPKSGGQQGELRPKFNIGMYEVHCQVSTSHHLIYRDLSSLRKDRSRVSLNTPSSARPMVLQRKRKKLISRGRTQGNERCRTFSSYIVSRHNYYYQSIISDTTWRERRLNAQAVERHKSHKKDIENEKLQ